MKELTHQKQSEVFDKIVRKDGRAFLVRFVILESCGKLRGKIISCEPVPELRDVKDKGLGIKDFQCYLPKLSNTQPAPTTRIQFREVVSPFVTLEFLTSIKIRAPSRRRELERTH